MSRTICLLRPPAANLRVRGLCASTIVTHLRCLHHGLTDLRACCTHTALPQVIEQMKDDPTKMEAAKGPAGKRKGTAAEHLLSLLTKVIEGEMPSVNDAVFLRATILANTNIVSRISARKPGCPCLLSRVLHSVLSSSSSPFAPAQYAPLNLKEELRSMKLDVSALPCPVMRPPP